MTDISRWPDFIEEVTKKCTLDGWGQNVKEYNDTRWVVPINDYQLGNMLWMFTEMLKQNDDNYNNRKGNLSFHSWNTGDWFYETIGILTELWGKMGIKTIQANSCPYEYNIDELKEMGWDLLRYDKKKREELCPKCSSWIIEVDHELCMDCEK